MSTLADRLALALKRLPDANQAGLARACGVRGPSVSDWFRGRTKVLKADSYRRAAQYLHCRREWLETGLGDPGWTDEQHTFAGAQMRGTQAQVLSEPSADYLPSLFWGEIMKTSSLPPEFKAAMTDDSMAPRVRAGDVLKFSTVAKPRPGDGVLVRDQTGALFFRQYRERRPGHWLAQPLNDAYQALDSEIDGLELVAVMVGIPDQRWG